jgi:hypothetical protein
MKIMKKFSETTVFIHMCWWREKKWTEYKSGRTRNSGERLISSIRKIQLIISMINTAENDNFYKKNIRKSNKKRKRNLLIHIEISTRWQRIVISEMILIIKI